MKQLHIVRTAEYCSKNQESYQSAANNVISSRGILFRWFKRCLQAHSHENIQTQVHTRFNDHQELDCYSFELFYIKFCKANTKLVGLFCSFLSIFSYIFHVYIDNDVMVTPFITKYFVLVVFL